jgi:hypothetical protein
MFKNRLILFLLIIVCGKAWARDEFEGIKCGADIPKSLVGKRDSNERVVVLEGRQRVLGLKDLGGTEISDRLFLVSWQICGSDWQARHTVASCAPGLYFPSIMPGVANTPARRSTISSAWMRTTLYLVIWNGMMRVRESVCQHYC